MAQDREKRRKVEVESSPKRVSLHIPAASVLSFWIKLRVIYAPGHFSPSPTGWAYLSQNINFHCSILRLCSIFQAMPSPSDGWHARSRRCQLALDLTIRGTGYTYPSLHSLGDCIVVGVFCVFCLWLMLLLSRNRFPLNLRLSLSFRWQKGDRPDNDLRWAMQHPDKKKNQAARHYNNGSYWTVLELSLSPLIFRPRNRHPFSASCTQEAPFWVCFFASRSFISQSKTLFSCTVLVAQFACGSYFRYLCRVGAVISSRGQNLSSSFLPDDNPYFF